MSVHRALIHLWYFLCYLPTFSNSYVLLYHTEDSPSVQHYDCIYYTRSKTQDNIQGVKYCRHFNESQPLQRDFNQSCHNDGQLWSFEKLASLNISTSNVLRWSSSLEQTDLYSQYLFNKLFDMKDEYICNCTNPSSFGKFCEYEFYGDSISFDEAITKQFKPLENNTMETGKVHVGSQLHDNRPCYMTWTCKSGLMCLDWRYICDGKQQCMYGLDEDYCERLEFNECEDDEYRCLNGMCIPDQYWLDGEYDCMDWTDEINTLVSSGTGCFNTPSFICDEHMCPYNQWSCGDGQCVPDETDRHEGVRYSQFHFCQNMRDVNYMCEAVIRDSKSWWTIDNGYCLPYSLAYKTLDLDTTAFTDKCALSIKCALSDGLSRDCECKSVIACRSWVINSCPNQNLLYPSSPPLLTSYTYMIYESDRDWTNKKPDLIGFNGRVKCIGYELLTNGGRVYTLGENIIIFYQNKVWENYLCNMRDGIEAIQNYTGPHYDVNCWNNSKTVNDRFYQVSFLCEMRCISKYRVRDGVFDCFVNEESKTINNSCSQIQRHRLQCSPSELTCLLVGALGNWGSSCSNGRDEFDDENDVVLTDIIQCNKKTDPGCVYLRNYIQISSENNTNKITIVKDSTTAIPFRSYCDSFFDTNSAVDESPELCEKWICSKNAYQCLSGQCISPKWLCDGEWDCSDGSDEERLLNMKNLSEHISKLMNLTQVKQQCHEQYQSDNTPFSDICDISSEYPCFRTGVDDPLDITLHRPCINLTQIGDGETDCLTGLDERNRLQCSDQGANAVYDTICFHQRNVSKNDIISNCNGLNDVMCLNDTCIKNAKCNGRKECLHGEDEYRCVPQNQSPMKYRFFKKIQFEALRLPNYPLSTQSLRTNRSLLLIHDETSKMLDRTLNSNVDDHLTRVFAKHYSKVKTVYETVRDALPNDTITFENDYLPFICNRGVAVKHHTGHTVCFCPPSFHGLQCEYYSDRITVLTHLHLDSHLLSFNELNIIKILTTFLFEDEIIDYYEFHVDPQIQVDNNYVKQQIYLVYLRSKQFLHMKKTNRSGTQSYSVRFEAFNLHLNGRIQIIGVWKYPIYFDYLPSFRLSTILRFRSSSDNDPCLNHSCSQNGICQKIINSNHRSYFCFCKSGYYGIYCEHYDEKCKKYCSPQSICKPKYRDILSGNQQHPFCLCPVSAFGQKCYFKNNHCQQNPCLNGGSCIVTYDLTDINMYKCICTDLFEGNHCQISKGMVNIRFRMSSNSTVQTSNVVAATVLYSDYNVPSLRLTVRHQQVYSGLPSDLKLIYSEELGTYAPTTAVLKVYESNDHNEEPNYYLLYFYPGQKEINITVDLTLENFCPLVETLWDSFQANEKPGYVQNSTFNSITAIFFYHRICQSKRNINTNLTCFRDLNYLCICEIDHYRAECFGYNRSIDQCSSCLSNGYCLKGELNVESDFLCLCQRCHYGQMCQYSNELMSFTLDSLIVKDIQNHRQISTGFYISIVLLIFLFGLFTNLNSFLTFIRPKPRKVAVGNYLLIISLIDQCSLLLLFLKVIHIILGSNGTLFSYTNLNLYSCKIVSYLLSVLVRINYWLTSFISIERLCLVLFPTSVTLKNPRRAIGFIIIVISFVSGMHIHELMYYTTIVDLSYPSVNVTVCVTNYVQSFVSTYNRVNVLIHYFIPFLIQIISITILIIQIACSRARAGGGSNQQTFVTVLKRQLKTQKEQYVIPIIIILSSLPQIIVSFSYACTELKHPWQRYTLLTTYFLSYLPQILGFILYVLPSTTYSEEFHQTATGKRFVRQQQVPTTRQRTFK